MTAVAVKSGACLVTKKLMIGISSYGSMIKDSELAELAFALVGDLVLTPNRAGDKTFVLQCRELATDLFRFQAGGGGDFFAAAGFGTLGQGLQNLTLRVTQCGGFT